MKQKPSLSRRNFAALLAATPVAATALEAQQQPAGAPNPNTSVPPQPNRQGTVNGVLPFNLKTAVSRWRRRADQCFR